MEITLPSLKERKEDKIPLAQFLLDKMITKYNRNDIVFSEKALEQMEKHAWNGNIREMENRIERAVILCDNNTISAGDLDLDLVTIYESKEDLPLSDIEKNTIEKCWSNTVITSANRQKN